MSDQGRESLLGWAVVGTYERQIAAFEVKQLTNPSTATTKKATTTTTTTNHEPIDSSIQFKGAFVGGAHLKPIKVLTAVQSSKEAETIGGKSRRKRSRSSPTTWVASAGEDDFIRIIDVRKRNEVTAISTLEAPATALQFSPNAYRYATRDDGRQGNEYGVLAAGGANGMVHIYDSARFDMVKKLKAHRHGVASLVFHPSGKFWLSVGQKDCTLKMYLSSTAKCAFDRKLDYKPMQLDFLSDGTLAILESSRIHIVDLEAGLAEPKRILQGGGGGGGGEKGADGFESSTESKFTVIKGISDRLIAGGHENGAVCLWDVRNDHNHQSKEDAVIFGSQDGTSKGRVKGIDRISDELIVAAYSTGTVKLWDCRRFDQSVASIECQGRITCLACCSSRA